MKLKQYYFSLKYYSILKKYTAEKCIQIPSIKINEIPSTFLHAKLKFLSTYVLKNETNSHRHVLRLNKLL